MQMTVVLSAHIVNYVILGNIMGARAIVIYLSLIWQLVCSRNVELEQMALYMWIVFVRLLVHFDFTIYIYI